MQNSSIQSLLEVVAALRDPVGGCPWDLKQTFASIVPYTLEEAYEVADAIERGDFDELRKELGDLLFQVVLYAQMAKEQGRFDFNEVVEGISDKMIRRHPHVFAGATFDDDAALKTAWENTKAQERKANDETGILAGVARALPALMRSEKLQKRAARVGFDWPDAHGALEKCREEIIEVEQAMASGDANKIKEEAGDLLFAAVNVCRLLGLDAEQTLRHSNDKFVNRFGAMERHLAQLGHADLSQLNLDQMEAAWQAVKSQEPHV